LVEGKTGQIGAMTYPSSVNKVSQSGVSEQETLMTHESSRGLNKEDETAITKQSVGIKRPDPLSNYELPHPNDVFGVYHSKYDPKPEVKFSPDGENGDGNWYYDDDDDDDYDDYDDYDDDDDDDDDWMNEVDEDNLNVDKEGVPIYPRSQKEYRQMISHRSCKHKHY